MLTNEVIVANNDTLAEFCKATDKFPTWPSDPLHALAIIGEEFGELTQAVLQEVYEPHKNKEGQIRKEAVQLAAMTLRFIVNLDKFEYEKSVQHEQV